MLNISQNNEEHIIIANTDNISENSVKNLIFFLRSNPEIFKEVNENKQENEIFLFFNKNLKLSLNSLEKYLKRQDIPFNLDEPILKEKIKHDQLAKKNTDLRKIGESLKESQKIPKEFELEYEEFSNFCGKNFPQKHRPYPNQIKSAFFHLKIEKSCNFSAPGTGKTTIVYALFSWLKKQKDDEVDAIFIIGPISSLLSWKNEYKECFGRNPQSIDFNLKNFKRELNSIDPYNKDIIYFLNYEKVKSHKKELIKFFRKYKILLILDEAHRIKNPNSQRSNDLSEILNDTKIDIPYQIILTGTPIPNGYENLYSYFDLTKRTEVSILSKSYEELKRIKNDDKNEIVEVFKQVSPFFYSLRKKDMENFKEPKYIKIFCEMEDFQEKLFNIIKKRLFDDWVKDIDKKINLEFFRSKIIRLMQIQTDIRMLLKPVNEIIFYSTKLKTDDVLEEELNSELKEVLENKTFDSDMKEFKIDTSEISEIKFEIEKYDREGKISDKYIKLLDKVKELLKNNEKVIIWFSWVYCINKISELLNREEIKFGLLYGAISYEKREEYIEAFNDEKNRELMILVANPASIGESISLHKACQNAIYFDINYNVTTHFQSKDRIHRCGMPKGKDQVTYYYLLSKNSMEEKILSHIQSKEQQMNNFLDTNQNLFIFKDSDFNNFMPGIDDIKETVDSFK